MRSSVDVHNYLVEHDVQHELFRVQGRLRTAERLAAVLELPPGEVGKVAVFESDAGPIAALVPSDRSADPKRVKSAAQVDEVKKASPARASALCDYIPDAIPPVALPKGFRVLMDTSLAEREVVYFHAGDSSAVLKLRGADLAQAAEATVAPLA
jgi:prolyl-tRNA editing enzyme YbaK/EbsC (Cys-tRNA(Pro) deacylase)